MRIVDTKGQACPKPIIETKKALNESKAGETFIVLTDNNVAFGNISKYLKDNKIKFTVIEDNGVWSFSITKETGDSKTASAEEYCGTILQKVPTGDFAIVISSEVMGQGDDELGRRLMKSFIGVIPCLETLPNAIAFYNSGVKLTLMDSDVLQPLKELEKKGVKIMICGTCTDHFRVTDQIGVGTISDMYLITSMLTSVGNIIKP